MEQGGLPESLLLAPFQVFVHEAAANSPVTQALFHWLLKEDRPAEGVPFEDLEAWAIAEALYQKGFLAEREWPCKP